MPANQFYNVLVTGGAGFIGSHLCERFVREGYNVICVDNFITGTEKNIDQLLTFPNFKFLRHDMTQPLDLEKFQELSLFQIKFKGLHEIYHLACPTSPKHSNSVPVETLLANSHGTYNALEVARRYGSKFLLASTAAVYGDLLPGMTRFKEDYLGYVDALGPRACYNEGKRFAETMTEYYRRYHSVDVKIARIFKTYGPRMKMNDGRLIPDYIMHALENEQIVVHGDPDTFVSSFLYITDLIDALIKMMASKESGPFNVGHNVIYRIHDVAQLIIKLAESSSTVTIAEAYPNLDKLGGPDISLIKEKLGWFPLIDVEEGMKKAIDFMQSQHGVINV